MSKKQFIKALASAKNIKNLHSKGGGETSWERNYAQQKKSKLVFIKAFMYENQMLPPTYLFCTLFNSELRQKNGEIPLVLLTKHETVLTRHLTMVMNTWDWQFWRLAIWVVERQLLLLPLLNCQVLNLCSTQNNWIPKSREGARNIRSLICIGRINEPNIYRRLQDFDFN